MWNQIKYCSVIALVVWSACAVRATMAGFDMSSPFGTPTQDPIVKQAAEHRERQQREATRSITASYDAVMNALDDADELVAAKQYEDATARFRTAQRTANELLAYVAGAAHQAGRGPAVRYATAHDGPLDEAALVDKLRAAQVRARHDGASSWDKAVAEIGHEIGAKTPGQRAVVLQHGRPRVTKKKKQTCWTYTVDDHAETWCWKRNGRLAAHTKPAAKVVVASAPTSAPAGAAHVDVPVEQPAQETVQASESSEPATEETSAATQQQPKPSPVDYYAAATFAAGECTYGKCATEGWRTRLPDGSYAETTCTYGKCLTEGWRTRYPDGSTSETSCRYSKCLTEGWTTRHPDGSSSDTSCTYGKCMTEGWRTVNPDGTSSETSCTYSKCLTEGWRTVFNGGSIECTCTYSDCAKEGTVCR